MPLPYPSRDACPWISGVPTPDDIPRLIEESLRRTREAHTGYRPKEPPEAPTEEGLRSWIAVSSLDWSMRTHLIEHLGRTLDQASSPDQKNLLLQLVKNGKGWNEAEIRHTRARLKPLSKEALWDLKVCQLKELARELNRRGVEVPSRPGMMRHLSIYTGSGVLKWFAVQCLWEALQPSPSGAEAQST